MKRVLSLCLTVGMLLASAASSFAADSIYDVIKKNKELTTFRKLVDACPQVREVFQSSPGPFTLLAPTDAAYARLDPATKALATDPKKAEILLLTQLLSGKWTMGGFQKNDGKHVMTYTQIGVQIRKTASGASIAGTNLLPSPLSTKNGTVFLVDRPIIVPPGMKLGLPARKDPPTESLFATIPIAPGREAPDFRLETLTGGHVTLAEALRGRRATLVYFWFVGCAPCRASIPNLNDLFDTLKGRGFGMLAINTSDTADAVRQFAKSQPLHFPVALNGKGRNDARERYFAEGAPTYIVVGADGFIIDSFTGSDKCRLLRALQKAGISE